MEDPLVVGAVAEERHDHLVAAPQPDRERGADRERHGGADDAVRAEDVALQVGDVHRAAEAAAVAGGAAHQLGHHAIGARTLGDAVAVAAMVARDVVVLAQMRAGAHGDRLFARIAVRRALDRARLEQLCDPLLEAADPHHVAIEALEIGCRQLQIGRDRQGFHGQPPPARFFQHRTPCRLLATAVRRANRRFEARGPKRRSR